MSKVKVNHDNLKSQDNAALIAFDEQVYGSLDREVWQRREDKRNPKKRKRGRR